MLKSRLFAAGMALVLCLMMYGVRVVAQTAADQDLQAAAQATPARAGTGNVESPAAKDAAAEAAPDDFDFFSDQPVLSAEVVELPPEPPPWPWRGSAWCC